MWQDFFRFLRANKNAYLTYLERRYFKPFPANIGIYICSMILQAGIESITDWLSDQFVDSCAQIASGYSIHKHSTRIGC